jgi:hypothetical protein
LLIAQLRDRLNSLANPDGSWSWTPDGPPATEPTALAVLALAADNPRDSHARRAADLLRSLQRPDGSISPGIGSVPGRDGPGWPTALAILAWQATATQAASRTRALNWLKLAQGKPEPNQIGQAIGHDMSLLGWSWAAGTHAWVEPTALAILALRRDGLERHPRVRAGLDLLRDRAIASGGWNYGNRLVLNRPQRPQPAPTALALLALAGTDHARPSQLIPPALDWLRKSLPTLRAGYSLGWSLLALRAWGVLATIDGACMTASAKHALRRPDPASALALLILAAHPDGLSPLLTQNDGVKT